jgi:hypothetical protein
MTTERTRLVRRLLALAALTLTTEARGDDPAPGTARTMPVVSVAVSVGSLDRETKRVVYAPPPGWYVRSHRVVTANKHGAVTYAVNTVPSGWNWFTDERTSASSKADLLAAVATPTAWYGGRAASAQDAATAGRQASTSSHHLLVVEVTARGAGLFLGGAGAELTVYAEMVYLGPDGSAGGCGPVARR